MKGSKTNNLKIDRFNEPLEPILKRALRCICYTHSASPLLLVKTLGIRAFATWAKNEGTLTIQTLSVFISRFRIIFVHMLPCVSLVTFNIMLFRAMKEAEKRRERLLNRRINRGGDTRDSKKIRDANRTTHMLIVVITVRNSLSTHNC